MPTYEYFCETCEESFEAVQKFTDAPLTSCPTGHEGVRRVFRPAGIIFKGSGWYIKDSKGTSTVSGSSSKSESAGESAKSGESTKSDASSKSETSSPSTSESKSDGKGPVATEAA